MRLSVSGQFTLKNRPKDCSGITGEHWNIGKDRPVSFSRMVLAFMFIASDFYTIFCDAAKMNTEMEKIRQALQDIEFETRKEALTSPSTPVSSARQPHQDGDSLL